MLNYVPMSREPAVLYCTRKRASNRWFAVQSGPVQAWLTQRLWEIYTSSWKKRILTGLYRPETVGAKAEFDTP